MPNVVPNNDKSTYRGPGLLRRLLRKDKDGLERNGPRFPFHERDRCIVGQQCRNADKGGCKGLFIGCDKFFPTGPVVLKDMWLSEDGELSFASSDLSIWGKKGLRVDVSVTIHEPTPEN